MADVTITAVEVRQPAPGKRTGVVKDQTGKFWYVWPDKLASFRPGGTYRITDYQTREFNGRVYYTVTQFESIAAAAAPNNMTFVDDNARRMDIFICGAFNNLMANPNVNPTELSMMDIIDNLHKFKGAWLGVFGPAPLPRPQQQRSNGTAPPQRQNEDMNDDIPF